MASKLDTIMKIKYSLNATNAPNVEEEFRQEKYHDNQQDESQQKVLVANDESNLEDAQANANANLSEMIQTNQLSISRRAATSINQ